MFGLCAGYTYKPIISGFALAGHILDFYLFFPGWSHTNTGLTVYLFFPGLVTHTNTRLTSGFDLAVTYTTIRLLSGFVLAGHIQTPDFYLILSQVSHTNTRLTSGFALGGHILDFYLFFPGWSHTNTGLISGFAWAGHTYKHQTSIWF